LVRVTNFSDHFDVKKKRDFLCTTKEKFLFLWDTKTSVREYSLREEKRQV
jgi:hypothetical protein